MAFRAKRVDSEDALYNYALRALARRAHSFYEMRQALERRASSKEQAQRVLARLKEQKHLDDARYARQFARYRAESRHQGRYRIARDLRARGVPDRHIEAALEEVFAAADEGALVRQRLARRLRSFKGKDARAALDRRKLASLYASLLRAGFSADTIRRELRSLTESGVELPEVEQLETTDEYG